MHLTSCFTGSSYNKREIKNHTSCREVQNYPLLGNWTRVESWLNGSRAQWVTRSVGEPGGVSFWVIPRWGLSSDLCFGFVFCSEEESLSCQLSELCRMEKWPSIFGFWISGSWVTLKLSEPGPVLGEALLRSQDCGNRNFWNCPYCYFETWV